MRVLIILIGLLGLAACSQKSAKVKLELTSSFAFGGSAATVAVSEGGLMVWGMSKDGDSFSRVLSDTDAIELEIPNGEWTFTAVAWDSGASGTPALNMLDNEGLRCARSAPMDLKGADVKVGLVLSTSNCSSLNFKGTASSVNASLKVHLCQSTEDVTLDSHGCTNDPQAPSRKSGKAPVMSVRLRLPEFDKFGTTVVTKGEGLVRCVTMPPGTLNGHWSPSPIDIAIPVGDPTSAPFRTIFELYVASSDCGVNGSTDNVPVTLPSGLGSPDGGHKYIGVGSTQHLFLNVPDDVLCTDRGDLTPFAGGNGSWEYPWLICSATQLNRIRTNTTYLTNSFRLMTDVNLNPFSKGFGASVPACWGEEGQNWQPIGTDASCASTTLGFRGSFFGGGHTITGMRMRVNQDDVGFIGRWSPAVTGGPHHITDLVFVDPEVEGISKVGAVVGSKPGGNAGIIGNIEVRGGTVSAGKSGLDSNLGGIAGYTLTTGLINLKTSRVKIEGEGHNIGGIFGYSVNAHVLRKLVSRSYVGSPDWAASYNVGGIGGYVASTVLLTGEFAEWASESIVVGGQQVGGLLGDWGSTQHGTSPFLHRPLENAYAAGSINIRGQSANHLGGLFGRNYNGALLNNAYFAGSLLSDPQIANCGGTCNVGWISGEANPMTLSNVYVAQEDDGSGNFSLRPRSGNGDDPNGASAPAAFSVTQRQPHKGVAPSIYEKSPMSALPASAWFHVEDDMPRLVFEKHPCSADADANSISPRSPLASQKNFWGSATKPMMICRKDQLTEITSHLGSGKIGVIVGALNLGSSAAHFPPNLSAGAYLTGEGGYIHGLRRVESDASADWAIFGNIYGALKHLLIAGLEFSRNNGDGSNNGLAVMNQGLIEDVKLLTGRLSQNNSSVDVSGLVNTNQGTMRDVDFEGTLIGHGALAGLVSSNSGIIEDSSAAGQLILTNNGSNIGGVAGTNSGTIRRVSVTSKLIGDTFIADYLGMVAFNNSGTIQDVHVTTEANWLAVFGEYVGQIVATQSGSPVLKRIIVEGFLHDVDDVITPTEGALNFVYTSLGSMTSLFVVPGGRLITEQQTSACASSTLTLPAGSFLSSFQSSPFWTGNLLNGSNIGNVVWALVEDDSGGVTYARVVSAAYSTNVTLNLDRSCTSLGFTGPTRRVRLLQDQNANLAASVGVLTGTNYVGFAASSTPYSSTNLTGPDWEEDIPLAPVDDTVIARDADVMTWILPIFGDYLNAGSTTRAVPIWEVEGDERIELFRIKK